MLQKMLADLQKLCEVLTPQGTTHSRIVNLMLLFHGIANMLQGP